jgi:hypothetical protein
MQARWTIALAILVVIGLAIRPAAARTVTYAIVIGNNAPPAERAEHMSPQVRPLRYADDDAVRYYQLFGAIGTATLLTVLDATTQRRYPGLAGAAEPPTLTTLRRVVASYAAAMAADNQRGDSPVLYFTFNGHGARDPSGAAFLALLDGPLTQRILYDEVLARLPATYSHVLVDACHAGGVVGVRGEFFDNEVSAHTTAVAPDDVVPLLEAERFARLPQVGVIVATTLGQEAHEWSEIEAGVFSHEVLSGLVGPADINGDGQIEYTEVQAFVAAANRSVKDPRAIVHVIARPPRANQNAALISLASIGRARVLAGPVGKLGHFYIELDNGQRYLDAHLADGASATIVLPAAGDAYVRTDSHEARVPAGDRIAIGDLRWSRRAIEGRGSIDSAYLSLFSSEYGTAYYRGYVDSIGALGVQFPPPVRDADRATAAGPPGHRGLAIAAASVAGASLIGSVAAVVLSVRARHDFEATDLQRPAQEAKQRYDRDRVLAVATGGLAIGAGVAAYWLWPRGSTTVASVVAGRKSYAIAIEAKW